MTFDQACARLVVMARRNGGTITAEQVEADPDLSADKPLVSAAARSLASATNVFGEDDGDQARRWFPYTAIRFTDLRTPTGTGG